MLGGVGCVVETAADGQEAYTKFQTQKFDCILMDCNMPVCDGYEATRLMRTLEEKEGRPRTRIVALTAYALESEVKKSEAAVRATVA